MCKLDQEKCCQHNIQMGRNDTERHEIAYGLIENFELTRLEHITIVVKSRFLMRIENQE